MKVPQNHMRNFTIRPLSQVPIKFYQFLNNRIETLDRP